MDGFPEGFAALSRSELWRAQKEFFSEVGVEAWREEVPYYVTSNSYLANAYAALLFALRCDCPAEEPVYVLELGAGPGVLSFRILRRLRELHEIAGRPLAGLRYVMSDVAEKNVRFWEGHPWLRPFVEEGVLDFAGFDVSGDSPLDLRRSGVRLDRDGPGSPERLLVVIANYLVDVTPQDLFRVHRGELQEVLVRTAVELPEPPSRSLRLDAVPDNVRCRHADLPYYGVPALDGLLEPLRDHGEDNLFSLPVSALRCLERLRERVARQVFLLVADKGLTEPEPAPGTSALVFGINGRCVSALVNFHALARYAVASGGTARHVSSRGIVTGAYSIGFDLASHPRTRLALAQHFETCNPGALFDVQEHFQRTQPQTSLETLVALLRLTSWDPTLFHACHETLLARLPYANAGAVQDLVAGLERITAQQLPIPGAADVWFDAGVLLQELRRYREALELYAGSLEHCGLSDFCLYNMGLCHYFLGEIDRALERFREVLEITPDYVSARGWIAQIEHERRANAPEG
ncbi:MAG TPA: tetratricopeptide repeat protein [Thermoanaerobaculia bacterium]